MSIVSKHRSPVRPMIESRAIICSTGNRFRVSKTEITKKKTQVTKSPAIEKPLVTKSPLTEKLDSSVTSNVSASTDDFSSSESSSVKTTSSKKITPSRRNGATKLNSDVAVAAVEDISPKIQGPVKRCHWITPNSGLLWRLTLFLFFMTATTSSVLTIHSPDGDIIDCVRRDAQLALSHPLLHNHKILERPTSFPNMAKMEDKSDWQIWHRSGTRCPKDTIPIRRVTESMESVAGVEATIGHEYAIGFINHSSSTNIYGTKATMSVWQPEVERPDEFSLGQIWLVTGSYNTSDLNSIEAGWQVYPEMYADHQPRFFIFWTNDSYTITKCYNLRCPGFIQTSGNILIEGAISPTSVLGGHQTELTIQIWKDEKYDIWWLAVGLNNGTVLEPVGYWPTELFTGLIEYAEHVQWGGEIVNKNISDHTTTQMGSGYLPSSKAAHMRDLEVAVTRTNFQPVYNLTVGATHPDFYRVKKNSDTSFVYGGPKHAGAVHLGRDMILLCFCLIVFFLF